MSLSPLQSVHQMELSWASKRKWSSLLRRWSDCIKRIQNSIQHLSYLVLKSDIGENILIPVFRWARTHQETRQRSRRLKERSTVSSELKLFWQWPLVKVIDTDTSGTWDWKALDAEKGSCDVIFTGWSRLKNLEPFSVILDLDWKSDTRGLQNDITISLTLQLFWAYLDPSSCSCVHPAFFVSSLQHTFFHVCSQYILENVRQMSDLFIPYISCHILPISAPMQQY